MLAVAAAKPLPPGGHQGKLEATHANTLRLETELTAGRASPPAVLTVHATAGAFPSEFPQHMCAHIDRDRGWCRRAASQRELSAMAMRLVTAPIGEDHQIRPAAPGDSEHGRRFRVCAGVLAVSELNGKMARTLGL